MNLNVFNKSHMACKAERQGGFLLTEVIVATVIISVALVAVVGMFIRSTQANMVAAEITAATNLAQQQLELLKAESHEFWQNQPIPVIQKDIRLNEVQYSVKANVYQNSTIHESLVKVVVQVRWRNDKELEMTALFPRIQI